MDRYRFNRSLFPDESQPPTPSTNNKTSGEAETTSSSGKENLDPAGDYLGASSKSYLIKILRKQGDRQVLFADKVLKYTGKGKVKRRFLIISEFAIYIIDPETNTLKRRVSLAAVEKIFMSQLHDHFIAIHVPTEYDILLASTRKTEIAKKLVDATRSSPDYELQVIRSNRFEYNASAELVKVVYNELVKGRVITRFVRVEAT
ncbi:hypothetical protein Droror1_Dr00009466 [Drosera rotundifolia]